MTRNEKIKELRKQGLTYEEIGKRYGLSRQRVEQICKTICHNNYYCKKQLKAIVMAKYASFSKFSELNNISSTRLGVIMNYHTPIRYSTAKKIHKSLKGFKFDDLFEEVER